MIGQDHVMLPESMNARARLRELIKELAARHANLEANADSYDKRDDVISRR